MSDGLASGVEPNPVSLIRLTIPFTNESELID
jgi:hypothetical protein